MSFKGNIKDFGNVDITKPKEERQCNYPDGRNGYSEERVIFPWRKVQYGQIALCCLYFYVEARMSLAQILYENKEGDSNSYKSYGLTKETTYAFLQRAVPELFEEYKIETGKEMEIDLPIKRIYMWFLQHEKSFKGCKRSITKEHPLRWANTLQMSEALQRTINAG